MTNILRILLFSFVWATILMSCSENINEGDEIETYPKDVVMTDYVLPEGCSWDGFLPDTIYLINSQEELTAHLACWANVIIPEIDFEKNSLIVVCGVNTSGIKSISSQLQQTATNAYELTVNIESFLTTVVEEWNVAKLVSKLEKDIKIELCVKLNNDIQTESYIVCGVNNPLQDIAWLREFCESLDEAKNLSSVRIDLYKIIDTDEYAFKIGVSYLETDDSPFAYSENWRNCIGEHIFNLNSGISPNPELVENFMRDKKFVAGLFYVVKQ